MVAASLEGRVFRDVTAEPGGDVGGETLFEYHEDADGTIWARYTGGAVRLGFLVGTRTDDALAFRYAHVTADASTATGNCLSQIETLADGRLRLHETWQWESKTGVGTSVVEEVSPSS